MYRRQATLTITGLSNATVAENTPWTSVQPTLTGTPIGDVTWTKEGTDADDFTIDPSTGVLSMVARDFESPVDDDTDNIYEVTVRVTDADDNTATKAITVTVTDVRETATLTITGLSNATVAENTPWTSAQPTLTGTPIGDVTWTKEGTDTDDFTIDPSTGVLSMAARDFESQDADQDNAYEVTVKATDADDNTATKEITVTVTDIQEQATLTITDLEDATVTERIPFTSSRPMLNGTPVGAVTWTKEGADAEDFTINASTGVLSMVARDYENPVDANTDNAYEVTVKATDADDNTATKAITVTVTDMKERATLTITGLSNATVAENTPWTSEPSLTGTPIGDVTWTVEGTDADDFTINASTGVLSMAAQDYESSEDDDADNIYEVTVKATDDDDNTATVEITVTVTDIQESATLAITGLEDDSVQENQAWTSEPSLTGTPIGDATWTKEGTDADDFTINASTGVLSMIARDYENPADQNTDNMYEVTVKATDDDDNTATKEITVTVTDVTETETQYTDGDLRLVDGKTENEGRLEIYHDGQWGTIVDDYWTDVESDVACRQLGYDAGSGGNSRRFLKSYFGGAATSVPIWLDDMNCTGDENRLVNCEHPPWGVHNARGDHVEDVGLRCALRRPRVQDVPALSGPGTDLLYGEGETVEVTLTFSEKVTVKTENGTPTVGLLLGGSTARTAGFVRGDGTTQLVFAYTLSTSDGSHESVRVPENSLRLNGGAISSDPHGGNVVLTHAGAERGGTPSPELTARFTAVPPEHVGVRFAFEVHFSENVVLSQNSAPGSFLDVTGGTVAKAEPLTGSNFGWNVEIDPASRADVTISLPMRSCGSSGAICTADSRVPSNRIDMTVPGPATFSVADAEVREGPEATLDFLVTLSRAKDERTWVYFETNDGTATAGEDYTATTGHLVFAPGVTSKTVSVSVLEDAHDEGSEILTLTVTQVHTEINGDIKSEMSEVVGIALIGDGTATGTIHDTDSQPKEKSQSKESNDALVLTARFESMPATHDGANAFKFKIQFSEEIAMSYVNMRDDVLDVSGGEVTGARRLVPGSNQGWEITVEPSSNTNVSISLSPTTDCNADSAVCTEDRTALSSSLAAMVSGPAPETETDTQTESDSSTNTTPLTARFESMPATHDGANALHDGANAFNFEIQFSEEIAMSYVNMRDDVLDVSGGTVTGARRLVSGSNQGWEITVEPSSNANVSISLSPTTDCNADSAVCTEGGTALSSSLAAMVSGPVQAASLSFGLDANYPNPFNAETQIAYTVPVAGLVELAVYNVLGQRERTLVQEEQAAGRHQVVWDGRNDMGTQVASGVYFYRFTSAQGVQVRRLLLLK